MPISGTILVTLQHLMNYPVFRNNNPHIIASLPLFFLLVILVFQPARVSGQTGSVITIEFKSTPFSIAIDSLEKTGGKRIFYSGTKIQGNQTVTGTFKGVPLKSVLKAIVPPDIEILEEKDRIILKPISVKKFVLSGFIREKGTEEFMIGVNVVEPSLQLITQTNAYGFFSITLPEGFHQLRISYIGFKTQLIEFNLKGNLEQKIYLEGDQNLSELVIKGADPQENPGINKVDINLKKMGNLPAFLGENDLIKYMTLQPGVSKGNDANQGMYIRGGTPDQNLIMVDDATIYSAYHLFGFTSLFSGYELRKAELNKGGFSARYGGRTSSVLNLSLKDGSREKWEGNAGIGLLASHVMVDGPIWKNRSSVLVSCRRTYLDLLSGPFMGENEKVGYSYFDFNSKINLDINPGNRIYFSIYTGQDKFNSLYKDGYSKDITDINWGNNALSFRWNHTLSRKVFLNTTAYHTGYRSSIKITTGDSSGQNIIEIYTGIKDYGVKLDVDFMFSPNHWIKAGISGIDHRFTPNLTKISNNGVSEVETENENKIEAFESIFYVEDQFRLNSKLSGNLGLRLNSFYTVHKNYLVPEPRLYLEYKPNRNWQINTSYTHMSQFVSLVSTGMMGLPSEIWIPASAALKPQIARQFSVGFGTRQWKNWHFGQEYFIKHTRNFTSYSEGTGPLSFFLSNQGFNLNYNYIEKMLIQGQMRSMGVENFIKYETPTLETWICYTLSRTNQQFSDVNNGNWFTATHDRRHDFSYVLVYKPNKRFVYSISWVYGSGFMLSLPSAQYNVTVHAPTDPNGIPLAFANYYTANYYSSKNNYRAASYHHLDLSVKYIIAKPKGTHFIGFNIYNAYNRQNPFYYSIEYNQNLQTNVLLQTSLVPVVPSINYRYAF